MRSSNFPLDQYLLITTPDQVVALTSQHYSILATSSKGAIRGATTTNAGRLVVADDHNLVIQDERRAQQRSWGLRSKSDKIRHVCFAGEALGLLYTNTNFLSVEQYSIQDGRVLEPIQSLHGQPTAMAVSAGGRYLLTSCQEPALSYLTFLQGDRRTLVIQSQVSRTSIIVVAFHPEHLDVFLLGHLDGNMVAYRADVILRRSPNDHHTDQRICSHAELGRMSKVLRTTAREQTGESATFNGAAFLPGHRCRVVAIGSDNRCRLIELDKSVILRTWRMQQCPLAVAISCLTFSRTTAQRLTSAEVYIAIAAVPLSIHLYSAIGQRLAVYRLPGQPTEVFSVQWMQGEPPTAPRVPIHTETQALLPALRRGKLHAKMPLSNSPRRTSCSRSSVTPVSAPTSSVCPIDVWLDSVRPSSSSPEPASSASDAECGPPIVPTHQQRSPRFFGIAKSLLLADMVEESEESPRGAEYRYGVAFNAG